MKTCRAVILCMMLVSIVSVSACGAQATPTPAAPRDLPTPTVVFVPAPTLLPPLASVVFPSQVIRYPADWPTELQFPSDFALVETTVGTLPDGVSKGWVVKLRFKGKAAMTADALNAFLSSVGWTIKRTNLPDDVILMTMERQNKQQTGSAIIEPEGQGSDYSKVFVTVRR